MNWKERILPALFLSLALLCTACGGEQAGPDQLSGTVPPEEPEEAPLTLEDIRTVTFSDVSDGDPWADEIRYVAYQGMMSGTGEETFSPDDLVTRAALTDVLYRMSGEEAPAYDGRYADVSEDDWYAGAVAWALQADLFDSTHIQTDTFGAGEPVTRAQLAALLVRYAGYWEAEASGVVQAVSPADQGSLAVMEATEAGAESYTAVEMRYDLGSYRDGDSVPEVLVPGVSKALEQGFLKGMVSDTIYPNLPVNRGQLAQALVVLNAVESGEPLAAELAENLQAGQAESVVAASHNAFQAKVDEIAAKYGAVGVQVAVVEEGRVTDSFAYGWATKGTDPMTADHKMRVASLSKVSVGMAAMLLREQGVIDLDASIGDYWGFPTRNGYYPDTPVSIRTLLSHTSSIPLYGDDVSRAKSAVEANLRNNRYNNLKPGSVWSWGYNNYGFSVLGLTLELAAQDYLDNILEQGLWSVMDIDAAFETGSIKDTGRLVTLYDHGGGVSRSLDAQRSYTRPASYASTGTSFAGGLTISANDTAKLLALLINDGRYQGLRLLSEESVAIMETRFDQILSDGTYQAMPLRSQDNIYGRDRLYYHTGSAYGVYNWMSYDPDAGDGIVVLSVGASAAKDGNGIYAVCGEISKYFYELTAASGWTAASESADSAAQASAESVEPAEA